MKKILFFLFLSSPFVLFAQLQYPETKKGETVENYHGTKVADPYRWLEDDHALEKMIIARKQKIG